MAEKDFVIITGVAAAGKSAALDRLEKLSFFCVDDVAPHLIPKIAQLADASSVERAAVVLTEPGEGFAEELFSALDQLGTLKFKPVIVLLDAANEALSSRTPKCSENFDRDEFNADIALQREALEQISGSADFIIDTSGMDVNGLESEIDRIFQPGGEEIPPIFVNVVSFGFKYGVPRDLDFLFDVRILPNPHYDVELRPLDGTDIRIQEYALQNESGREYLGKIFDIIDFVLPQYIKRGKSRLTIGVGCTGGRHRSVAVADRLMGRLMAEGYRVYQDHRDRTR